MRVLLIVTMVVSAALMLSSSKDGFCLVTVYEANTHTVTGADEGFCGDNRREATLNGKTLLLSSLPAMLKFARLGVLRETFCAGQGSSVFLCSAFGSSRIRIGSSQGASVFDDDLVIRAGPEGRLDVLFMGSTRTLLPDEGVSLIAVRNADRSRVVHEDQQLSQHQIDQLLQDGLPVSRLIVYNHGFFSVSQVKRVSP